MQRTRFSRSLIGLLLVTLVLGGAVYLHNNRQTTPKPTLATVIATAVAVPPPQAAVVPTTAPAPTVTVTPTTNPSVVASTPLPTPPVMAATATTQPAQAQLAAWSPVPTALPPAPSSDFLASANAKSTTGDLLGARSMLNDALLSGHLSPADIDAAQKSIGTINDTLIFSTRRFPQDEYGGIYIVKPRDSLRKIADSFDVPWELLLKINGLSDPRKLQAGGKLKIVKGPFNVVVNKKAFRLDLYLGGTPGSPGSMYVRSYPVGLGRDDSTPTGSWLVEMNHKVKNPVYYSPRGEGVVAADDPKNPLGHRWIGLTGVDGQAVGAQSYGIHGTIDPDSIGKQASMGCIRMRNEDVEVVFDLLAEGKSIVVVKN